MEGRRITRPAVGFSIEPDVNSALCRNTPLQKMIVSTFRTFMTKSNEIAIRMLATCAVIILVLVQSHYSMDRVRRGSLFKGQSTVHYNCMTQMSQIAHEP